MIPPVTSHRPARISLHRLAALAGAASLSAAFGAAASVEPGADSSLEVRISFGHQTSQQATLAPRLLPGSPGMDVEAVATELTVGSGRIPSVTARVSWPEPTEPRREVHSIWGYLFEHGEPGQVARLRADPGLQPGSPVLTVQLSDDGTRGFSVGLEQLARHGAMWVPEHDAFVTLEGAPVDLSGHLATLEGERVLDRVKREPEASLQRWRSRWGDVGNPLEWESPWETSWLGTRGHLTGLVARHGSLYKFGVDRWANVRPDFASPHMFRLDVLWPESRWVGQRIEEGLPILVTRLERDGRRCEIEQFAALLGDEPPAERGEIASVVFSRVTLSGEAGPVRLGFRLSAESTDPRLELRRVDDRWLIVDRASEDAWLEIDAGESLALEPHPPVTDDTLSTVAFDVVGELTAGTTRDVVLKLASPPVHEAGLEALRTLAFAPARAATVDYWEDWLARGARFTVPEEAVNDLFRASLWHALVLPRFRTDESGAERIDLPYSNFAYGQLGADWPINQAVYVDYMIHGLRGLYGVADEELAAIYRNQQQPDGRVGGYAEWGVYSPSMLYAIGQNYVLSRDRASFERLLPRSLKALDWCLAQAEKRAESPATAGVIVAPLNDNTPEDRAWAFPNAYFAGGLETFSRALAVHGHHRAREVGAVARQMRQDVARAFARASVQSPVVQLADGTWSNYVPSDAGAPRRLLDEWYPTDVDTGPLHLSRLAGVEPPGWLTTAMLNDHEDNLFLRQWGAANEPVYNQQATAYLLRDEPKAAIRAFYSMMASAFSHRQLTPLEHRWAWDIYSMPPSTDGAWFELYRNMLVNELAGDGTLFVGQAVPRAWLREGGVVEVVGAPTWFGPVDLRIESGEGHDVIRATVEFLGARRPETLLVRLRHPERRPLEAVTLNGVEWRDFDPAREWVRVSAPEGARLEIVARY
jgi:hypothetical protein